jgi:hypothetical protein
MKRYKQQLCTALIGQGWELVSQLPPTSSWADEHWRLQSRREQWGCTIILSFILSPMDEGNQKPLPVWSIRATAEIPDSWMDDPTDIASLDLRKGRFDEKLPIFLAQLSTTVGVIR